MSLCERSGRPAFSAEGKGPTGSVEGGHSNRREGGSQKARESSASGGRAVGAVEWDLRGDGRQRQGIWVEEKETRESSERESLSTPLSPS